MKVVVISASPRKTGKTQVFMEYVTKYIDETNFENDKIKIHIRITKMFTILHYPT